MIHLAITATVPVIERHGIDHILKPFLNDIKKLESTGLSVTINGTSRTFNGSLLVFLADNLASHMLGGFKESFSFSTRICRTCNASQATYKTLFNSNSFILRTDSQHRSQCDLLQGQLESHFSQSHGIKRRSMLLDLSSFRLVEGGLPHDAMHDIFEGVCVREINLLLHHCINAKYFSLQEYNQRLVSFDYGYNETDKPHPITSRSLREKSFRASASQMILLCHILPLLIGKHVPEDDEYWKCFLMLLDIIDVVLLPILSDDI